MSRLLLAILFVLLSFSIYGQSIEIYGKVGSETNIENIHVINKTAQVFTITDINGRFMIPVKLNDTLNFSSVQHKLIEVIISNEIISAKAIFVKLEEQINELDEVLVGKVLTGDLFSDINNIEGDAPINFYDVGISGYTGKPATQSERRLSEASDLNPTAGGSLGGAGASISFTPLINAITGRTKMLKRRVEIEEKETLIRSVKGRLSKDFFASNPLEDTLKMDFFYFCADDENFIKHCKNQNDFKILIFLRIKYKQYLENIDSNKK